MTELLSEILSLTLAGVIVAFFALIIFTALAALWMAITGRGKLRRRPDCYKTHEYKPHKAVLFDCALCPYEKECWK
jgi:hypothetical protein